MSAQTVEIADVAPTLRLLPAPVSEPRVERPVVLRGAQGSDRRDGPEQPARPERTAGQDPTRGPEPTLQYPIPLADGARDQLSRPRTTPTAELPDPSRWAGQFVQAAVEVAGGVRPPIQLVRWTSEEVLATLTRRNDLAVRARRAGRLADRGRTVVRSVRSCPVRDGVVEASAVVTDGVRARAVALRLEGLDGRWRVTALELG
jgi:hypothetical protein